MRWSSPPRREAFENHPSYRFARNPEASEIAQGRANAEGGRGAARKNARGLFEKSPLDPQKLSD